MKVGVQENKEREVIHRCNNFLTMLGLQGDYALSVDSKEALQEALTTILKESAELEAFLRERRQRLEG